MNATYMIPAPSIVFLLGILIAVFLLTFSAAKNRQDEPKHRGAFRKVFHGLLTFLQAFLTTVFLGGLAAGLGLLLLKSPLKDAMLPATGNAAPDFGAAQQVPQPNPYDTQPGPSSPPSVFRLPGRNVGPQFEGILNQLESVERQLEQQLRSIQINPQGVSDNLRKSVGELKGRLEADRLRMQTMIKEQSKSVQEQILRQEMEQAQARVTEQAKRLEELEKEVEKSRRVTEHMEERAWDRTRQTPVEDLVAPQDQLQAVPAAPDATPEEVSPSNEQQEGVKEIVPNTQPEAPQEDSVNPDETTF